MGALQPGLPTPSAIPANTFKIILDLKDCFYTIPLAPEDCKRFAFSVPSTNFKEPMKRYQWLVLPQGMANSPTLYQKYVSQAIEDTRRLYSEVYIIHYMDDILLACLNEGVLLRTFAHLQRSLEVHGLVIGPEKIQKKPPYSYLGYTLLPRAIMPQKVELRKDKLQTLNDFPKLLGDINWLRSHLQITTGELKPLFDILKGDADPTSPRQLTEEGPKALQLVETAIKKQQVTYLNYAKPWEAYILTTAHTPTAVLWQHGPLLWMPLPVSPARVLTPYHEAVGALVQISRVESNKYFGAEPQSIGIPFMKMQTEWLFQNSDAWIIAFANFAGKIDNH